MSVESHKVHGRVQKSSRPIPLREVSLAELFPLVPAAKVHQRLQPGNRAYKFRHQALLGHYVENGGNWYRAALAAGYSHNSAKSPEKIMRSKSFIQLLEDAMPDQALLDTHGQLLTSKKLDHMVFPLGPSGEDDANFSGSQPNAPSAIEKAGVPVERTTLTDGEIKLLIADIGGTVRRIVHGDTARHVYFWAPNDKARQDALKLAYDLKGKLAVKEPPPPGNTYNTQINIGDETPRGAELLQNFGDYVKQQTMPRKQVESEHSSE